MSRRIVILQRGNDRVEAVTAALVGRGHSVAVARSLEEATALIRERCGAVLIDAPDPDCNGSLCRYVRYEVRPMPTMVGLLSPERPVGDDLPGTGPADGFPDEGAEVVGGALPGRESTPHPCHGCMVVLSSETAVEEIAAAVEAAVRWWPGDD